MKASLLTAGALACTLATLASAQRQTRPEKPLTRQTETELKLKLLEEQKLAITQKKMAAAQLQTATQQSSGPLATAATNPTPPGSMQMVLPPANDACAAATAISGPGPHAWTNVTATTDGPSNCGIMTKDVWYDWTSGAAGNYILTLCAGTASTVDTVLTVYTGAGCPVGASLACDDDFCNGFGPSRVAFSAAAATVYKIQIGVYNNGAEGSGTFDITPAPAGPPNDNCTAATAIAGAGTFPFTNVGAVTDGPANCGAMSKDVWFNWTSGAAGAYIVTTCGGTTIDTVLTAYTGAGCPVGASLACNDDFCGLQSRLVFAAAAATVYKIQIGVFSNGTEGSGTFDILLAPPPPANDLCASAVAISGAGPHAWTNVSALLDGPTNCGAFTGDVWYDWTNLTATGPYDASICGGQAAFDTMLSIYDTSACQGALLGCNDQFCGNQSEVTFPATTGNIYKVQIGGWNNQEGSGTFTIAPAPPPPANDLCASAVAISGAGPHAWTNVNALLDGPTNCGAFTGDVWYDWTNLTATGSYDASDCGQAGFDTMLSVYDTAACQGALLGCNDQFCGNESKVSFPATTGNVYKVQIGGWNNQEGSGTFTISPTPPPPANDVCGSPVAISGAGPHAFDTTQATTGAEGQTEALCNAFATTAVDNDIWYTWTAGATGLATLSVCGQSAVDTKVAVYPGTPACPTAGTALACNDDTCGLQSQICWGVTNGQTYTIQMGTFPGAQGGAGTFGVAVGGAGGACQADDGTSEDALGWTAGGEMGFVQRFGPSSGPTSVSSVQVSWGTAAFPGGHPANGSAVKVLLYEDPNNDGIPDDLVLVQQVNTTVANVDTDTFNTIPVTPVNMNGYFFAGAGVIHAAGQFVAAMDTTTPDCEGRTWFFGDNTGAAVNYVNPSANLFPPDSFAANGFACNLMVRAGCGPSSPMVGECFPGTGGVINCPCPTQAPANPAGGCASHGAGSTSGAVLSASGVADASDDAGTPSLFITISNLRAPASGVLNVFFSYKPGGATPTPGTISAAGIRCTGTGGSLKRLYTMQVFGGGTTKPGMGDLSIADQSATFPGHAIAPPETRHYFNVYRDGQASTASCPSGALATTNLSNMGAVSWVP